MAWTSPRTWVSGEVVTAALLNTHVRDNLKAIGDPWGTWTPTLTGFTVSSSQAYYRQAGKTIHASYIATLSSVVSATMAVSLPVAAARAPSSPLRLPIGVVHALDQGVARRNGLVCLAASATVIEFWSDNASSPWAATQPFTWASGDEIGFSITYEGA
jgi:hypothetical protein